MSLKYKKVKFYMFGKTFCKKFTNFSGFTLIEMIIVILIIALITAIGVPFLLSATNAISFLTIRTDLDQMADVAISRISQEIKRLKDDRSILIANQTQFSFIDREGSTISYSRNGANLNLMRNTDILASRIEDLSFSYFDDLGSPITNPPIVGSGVLTNIRRVGISLTFSFSPYKLYYKTQVVPKNLRHLKYKFQ